MEQTFDILTLLVGLIHVLCIGIFLLVAVNRIFRGDVLGWERALILGVLFGISGYVWMDGATTMDNQIQAEWDKIKAACTQKGGE